MNDVSAPALAERPAAADAPQSAAPRHVLLIDGSGFIFRAYFARARDTKAERFQRKSDGVPTEVVTIFSNMLDKYLRETDADHVAVILDASGRSFRNELYDQYKANRRETPDDLVPQCEHVRQAADAFGVCRIELDNFEADDLIATYARHAVEAGAKVTILSSDKDLMQLVHDGHIAMRDPMTDRPIGEAEVREKFGVGAGQGRRGTGAVRRQHRQRARRAGDRGQDRGRADQRLWRSRNAAGAGGRDQAAEAPPVADRERGEGTAVEGARQARRRRAAALPAIGAAGQAV